MSSVDTGSGHAETGVSSDLDEAIGLFIEQMGLVAEEDHLPRIAGRIWGLMLVEERPLHFEEMAERLQVSRGSVSTNVRRLVDLHVLERLSRPGDRRDYWVLSQRPATDPLQRVIEQHRRRASLVGSMSRRLAQSRPVAAQRLQQLSRIYDAVSEGLDSALDQLTDEPPRRSGSGQGLA